MLRNTLAAAILAAIAAPASAQDGQAPRLDLETRLTGCEPAAPGEVVVCAERGGDSRYRIDPDVLQVMRKDEPLPRPQSRPLQVADGDPCKVGPNGCPGEGAVPVSAIALLAAKVAVKALKGEDWREPLRTSPDEYRLYQESKDKREKARAKVTIGVGVQPGRNAP